jgi:hypothetical protein
LDNFFFKLTIYYVQFASNKSPEISHVSRGRYVDSDADFDSDTPINHFSVPPYNPYRRRHNHAQQQLAIAGYRSLDQERDGIVAAVDDDESHYEINTGTLDHHHSLEALSDDDAAENSDLLAAAADDEDDFAIRPQLQSKQVLEDSDDGDFDMASLDDHELEQSEDDKVASHADANAKARSAARLEEDNADELDDDLDLERDIKPTLSQHSRIPQQHKPLQQHKTHDFEQNIEPPAAPSSFKSATSAKLIPSVHTSSVFRVGADLETVKRSLAVSTLSSADKSKYSTEIAHMESELTALVQPKLSHEEQATIVSNLKKETAAIRKIVQSIDKHSPKQSETVKAAIDLVKRVSSKLPGELSCMY